MTLSTIITWLLGLWNALRGGGGSRVKLLVISEAAVAEEKKRRDKLWARMVGIDNELKDTILRIIKAKNAGYSTLEGKLNDKRDLLLHQFREAKRQYEELKNNE